MPGEYSSTQLEVSNLNNFTLPAGDYPYNEDILRHIESGVLTSSSIRDQVSIIRNRKHITEAGQQLVQPASDFIHALVRSHNAIRLPDTKAELQQLGSHLVESRYLWRQP